MNEDEKDQFYKAGYLAGAEHKVSSPETKKAITQLTMELGFIKKDVKDIKEKVDNLPTSDQMKLANEKLVERIFKEVKENYTTKSEFELTITPMKRIVYGAVTIILAIVISAVIYTVVK